MRSYLLREMLENTYRLVNIHLECVIDRHPIDNTLPISSFPINMAVAKSITRSHNQSVNSSYANKNSSYQSVNSSNSFPTLNNQKPIY